ncbi:Predicted membrane protein [Citrobacter freundii]|nr:Predicted membrane protein [Citrobacter freundii]
MLAALVVMLWATRRRSRREWLCGAVLLGIVIVKLMLVDSAGGGGLARAVAFIGVAILVLIIGYFFTITAQSWRRKMKWMKAVLWSALLGATGAAWSSNTATDAPADYAKGVTLLTLGSEQLV